MKQVKNPLARTALAATFAIVLTASQGALAYGAAATTEGAVAETNATVLASRILSRWEPVAQAAGVDSTTWHEQFATQFSLMSVRTLQTLDALSVKADATAASNYAQFAQSYRNALMTSYVDGTASKAMLKLGSSSTDQIFVPITPCRVVDTRNVGGPITFGNARNFLYWTNNGTYTWANQGGAPGQSGTSCPGTVNPNGGAPSAAVATVTVVTPSAGGNFVAWGGASPVPTTSVLNWGAAGDIGANTTVIPYGGRSGTGPGGSIMDFAIYYNGPSGSAQVIVDIIGYFVENQQTPLQCAVVDVFGTGTVANATFETVNLGSCAAGYTSTGVGCDYNGSLPAGAYLQEASQYYNYCVWYNGSGAPLTGASFGAHRTCCRVPGR